MHNFLTWRNQDLVESGAAIRMCLAILLRMLSWSRVIIPNRESCFLCSSASAGKIPATKNMKHSGVFSFNFIFNQRF